MNKRVARVRAEEGKLSIGELRAMIAAARDRYGMSRVNPALTLEQALDIYQAALAGRDDAEVPPAWRTDPYSRSGQMKPTRDVMIITNILRDAAP